MLSGHEADDNRDVLYVARVDGALAGSTKLCVSTDPHPWFGGLGEVSTLPEFRRRGIAEALCTRAREDFISVGGKMLVLGTVNPLAARRYFAIGYRRMPGAHDRLLAFFSSQGGVVTPMPRRLRRRHQLLVERLRGRSQPGGVGDGPIPRRSGGAAVGERGDSRSAHPDDLLDLLPERPGRARRQHPSAPRPRPFAFEGADPASLASQGSTPRAARSRGLSWASIPAMPRSASRTGPAAATTTAYAGPGGRSRPPAGSLSGSAPPLRRWMVTHPTPVRAAPVSLGWS